MKQKLKDKAVHAVAHTARIGHALERRPAHPRLGEYDRSLITHQALWMTLSDTDKAEVCETLRANLPIDLTADDVDAAITTLEG